MLSFIKRGDVRIPAVVVAVCRTDRSRLLRPDDGTWSEFIKSMELQDDVRDNRPPRHTSVATVWPSAATSSSAKAKEKIWTAEEVFGKKISEPKTGLKLVPVDFRALMTVPAPLPPAPKPTHVQVRREKPTVVVSASSTNKIFTGRRHHK